MVKRTEQVIKDAERLLFVLSHDKEVRTNNVYTVWATNMRTQELQHQNELTDRQIACRMRPIGSISDNFENYWLRRFRRACDLLKHDKKVYMRHPANGTKSFIGRCKQK